MSSKIKVDTIENVAGSGNVSLGSGHNLVVPGNITGQGTTTLTGDLAVDTNVLKVDTSNNRVGINTTSPSNDLHISSTNPVIRLQDTSTNAYAQIFTNDAGSMRLRADAGNSQGSSDFILEIDGTTQLSVDNSGRVLKPNQPAFRASRTAGNLSSAVTIIWNNVIYNKGNHYDNTNGRFTAPVAGAYQFNVMGSITGSPANSGIHRAWINGNAQADMFPIATSSASHISYSSSFVFNLSANDYVYITAASGLWYGTGNVHNHFSGFLIG